MNPQLIALVLCPRCRGALEVKDDAPTSLCCASCGAEFPIVDGVPRLAGDTYAASFGRQWNRYDVARHEEDEATFRVKTGVAPAELAGKLVLDAGCGGGRYSRLLGSHGATVIGVDLSAAVEKARSLCADLPEVQIIQADLLDLPLADAAFDMVYSIGVLHHTPNPRLGVQPDRQQGEAWWKARRLALSQEHIAAGMAQHGVEGSHHAAAGARARTDRAPGWASWAAFRCSTERSTRLATFPATPTGYSASAITLTGTPHATSRTTPWTS